MNRESRILQLLGVSNQRATHIRLVKGTVKVNPHTRVLCPTLASGKDCSKGANSYRFRKPYRPKFLTRNFNDPSLELWMCEGCRDKFLLRVII